MYSDPSGCFAVSTFLISLAVGSLATWAAGEIFGHQLVGGVGSIAGGGAAISTGISLFAFGPVGWIGGTLLIATGAMSMIGGSYH